MGSPGKGGIFLNKSLESWKTGQKLVINSKYELSESPNLKEESVDLNLVAQTTI